MGGSISNTLSDGTSLLPFIKVNKLSWIETMPCFSNLSDGQLELVANKVQLFSFKSNEFIIQEGTIGRLFGILVKGKVEISAIGPSKYTYSSYW